MSDRTRPDQADPGGARSFLVGVSDGEELFGEPTP